MMFYEFSPRTTRSQESSGTTTGSFMLRGRDESDVDILVEFLGKATFGDNMDPKHFLENVLDRSIW